VLKASTRSLIALSVLAALSGCAQKSGSPEQAAAAKGVTEEVKMAHSQKSGHKINVDLSNIVKVEGGKTVAEVYADKDKLAGQKVSVRGKVVKTVHDVMGKNWVHVRDGSGAEGANDLTITTKAELPQVGDLVLIDGTVAANKDFGMGYMYPVMVEDAGIKIEVAAPPSGEDD
jgi:ABC-type Fe3+-hydroxamate transport system substrate-binding protein